MPRREEGKFRVLKLFLRRFTTVFLPVSPVVSGFHLEGVRFRGNGTLSSPSRDVSPAVGRTLDSARRVRGSSPDFRVIFLRLIVWVIISFFSSVY